MAIYHFNCKIVSRSSGANAVEKLAYQHCSKEYDPTTDLTFDYSRKKGHVHHNVLLPENAPAEFSDAHALVVSIEEKEKGANAQLMRSLDAALPNELTKDQQIALVEDFSNNVWVKDGMCVIYDMHDAHKKYRTGVKQKNDHVHFKLSLREIDEKGNWKAKSKKIYLCRNSSGEEKFLDANEFRNDKNGFEKVYKYKYKNNYIELTSSEAQQEKYKNYKRISKYPVDKKVDANDWNEHSKLQYWRSEWANYVNKHLALNGFEERVSEKSLEEQGIEKIPQQHIGPAANAIEDQEKEFLFRTGQLEKYEPVTEKGKINFEIEKQNKKIEKINQELEICRKNIEQMKKVIMSTVDLERQKDFEIEDTESFNNLFEQQYKEFEKAYLRNHELFKIAYNNLNFNDQLYADVLISNLDKYVYSDDATETKKKLAENADRYNYAYNIYSVSKQIEKVEEINFYEDEINNLEIKIKDLNKMRANTFAFERDLYSLNKDREMTTFLDRSQRKTIDKEINEIRNKEIEYENRVDEIAENEEIDFRSGLSLREKIDVIVQFIEDTIIYYTDLISEKIESLRNVKDAIKEAFNIILDKDLDIQTKEEFDDRIADAELKSININSKADKEINNEKTLDSIKEERGE